MTYKVKYRNIEATLPDLTLAREWLNSVAENDPKTDGHYEQQSLTGVEIIGYLEADDGTLAYHAVGSAVQNED